jgi:anti-sigma28 factor (negative regulator of flagellin synthesis)
MVILNPALQPVADPAQDKFNGNRARPGDTTAAAPADSTDFSPEAKEAAAIARLAERIKESEIRKEKVEEAKRRIEEGAHRLVDIVNVVAERISGLVTV